MAFSQVSDISFRLLPTCLQTLFAIYSKTCQTLFQTFAHCHLNSLCCSIGFWADDLFLDHSSIIDLDLVLCTGCDSELVDLLLSSSPVIDSYALVVLRDQGIIMNDRKIEQSNECSFDQQQVLANSIENIISQQQQFIHPAPARGPSRFCPHSKGRRPSPPI